MALVFASAGASGTSAPQSTWDERPSPPREVLVDALAGGAREEIDPWSGKLRLAVELLRLPGAGGLDLSVTARYRSAPLETTYYYPWYNLRDNPGAGLGMGWRIGFGHVELYREYHSSSPDVGWLRWWLEHGGQCALRDDEFAEEHGLLQGDIPAKMVRPDGRRVALFQAPSEQDADFVTRDRWRAQCLSGGEGGGLEITSPEGLRYTYDLFVAEETQQAIDYYYPTRIEDPNGNWIALEYVHHDELNDPDPDDLEDLAYLSPPVVLISAITAGDGRAVTFQYAEGEDVPLLESVTAHGRTWTFEYLQRWMDWTKRGYPEGAVVHFLERIVGPEEAQWKFSYPESEDPEVVGALSLSGLVSPYGSQSTYSYTLVEHPEMSYWVWDTSDSGHVEPRMITSVASKTRGGVGMSTGSWVLDYGSEEGMDETQVTTPVGQTLYRHCGLDGLLSGQCSAEGALYEKLTYGPGGELMERETNTWYFISVSSDDIMVATSDSDGALQQWEWSDVWEPTLAQRSVERDGQSYTTVRFNQDYWDNAGFVGAYSGTPLSYPSYPGEGVRWVQYSFNTANLDCGVRQVTWEYLYEFFSHSGIARSYDEQCNLDTESRYGDVTSYTYHDSGEVHTVTDPRGYVTEYLDYHRGVARQALYPEGVTLSWEVDDFGRVTQAVDGRGKTHTFSYDGLGRVTGRGTPRSDDADVAIARTWWSEGDCCDEGAAQQGMSSTADTPSTRTVTRQTFTEYRELSGLGQATRVDSADASRTYSYNALGWLSFVSDPNSAQGWEYTRDALGRVVQARHTADGASVGYAYLAEDTVEVTDERGYLTRYLYQAYGDPDARELIGIEAPEEVNIEVARYMRGDVYSVAQGELIRYYTLDERFRLDWAYHPETGYHYYAHDANGNLTQHSVESSGVTYYSYDGLNRRTGVDYPGQTPDVELVYDNSDNLRSLTKGETAWVYEYDDNDNLTHETLTVDGKSFALEHRYDGKDAPQGLVYPSGLEVDYAPDGLGRPTQLGEFASSVTYHPNGSVHTVSLANGVVETTELDARQRPWTVSASGQVELTYQYDLAGNTEDILDALDSANDRHLSYDGLNRLSTASGPWGTGSLEYNTRGDIERKTVGDEDLVYSYGETQARLSSVTGTQDYTVYYDVYGNVVDNGRQVLDYDDASNLVMNQDSGTSHVYDGHDRRAKSQWADGAVRVSVYDRAGRLMVEEEIAAECGASKRKEYIRLGRRLIASRVDDTLEGSAPVLTITSPGDGTSVVEGTPVEFSGTASDAEDGELSAAIAWSSSLDGSLGSGASVSVSLSVGEHEVSASVTDSDCTTTTASVGVTVTAAPVNTAPVAQDDTASTAEGTAVTVAVLDNDSDADGDMLEVTSVTAPAEGSAVIDAGGQSVTYTPNAGFSGTDSFGYTVSDEAGASASAQVTVTVLGALGGSITVTPTSWEGTSEDGLSATFSVVLDSAPSADVTIGLSSTDVTEGRVEPASVSFGAQDWSVAQTVTVTGVRDCQVDGDVLYTVETAPAISTDTDYDGVDGADLRLVNHDTTPQSVHAQLRVCGYERVSMQRQGPTIWEYTSRAQLRNFGAAVSGVSATLTTSGAGTSIIDGEVSFGAVGAGETVTSEDTFVIRHDRRYPLYPQALTWEAQATP